MSVYHHNLLRKAPLPRFYPYLSNSIPQTQYPYDSVYNTTTTTNHHQRNITHPKYQFYGNMEYPYYVRRQRIPKVYTRPKPSFSKYGNHYYQIPGYPPYIYWYPNPLKCRDTCGDRICNAYFRKINDYRNCRRCQNQKVPKCWNPVKQQCVSCPPQQALENCSSRSRFGCANPNGWQMADTSPVNPIYTGCKLCH